jgi:hypothetical protein
MIPDLSQIHDFKALHVHYSRSSQIQLPWNGQHIHAKEPNSAVIFEHYLKTYFINFGKPDVSRVADFSWIPQHPWRRASSGSRGWWSASWQLRHKRVPQHKRWMMLEMSKPLSWQVPEQSLWSLASVIYVAYSDRVCLETVKHTFKIHDLFRISSSCFGVVFAEASPNPPNVKCFY